jgi:hypothetical protein
VVHSRSHLHLDRRVIVFVTSADRNLTLYTSLMDLMALCKVPGGGMRVARIHTDETGLCLALCGVNDCVAECDLEIEKCKI